MITPNTDLEKKINDLETRITAVLKEIHDFKKHMKHEMSELDHEFAHQKIAEIKTKITEIISKEE